MKRYLQEGWTLQAMLDRQSTFSPWREHPVAALIYEFGEFLLDASQFALLRRGIAMRLERKPLELLILLVSGQGRLVGREEISACLWGEGVFVDTEHGINTAMRKIRTVLREDTAKPRYIQTVTGKGYRFIASVRVSGQAVPEEEGREEEVEEVAAATTAPDERPRPRLWIGAGVVGALLVAGVAVLALVRTQSAADVRAEARTASIAVLPLANFSGDADKDYFADGMTDELTTMLAKDSTLRVTSRTSAMQYRGRAQPLGDIARALHVDLILEGSVTRSAHEVHMTLQLIRADTDTHLWAESYDRDVKGAAGLPDEAARAIAAQLHRASANPPAVRYVNPEAHDAYLRGHYSWTVGRNEDAGRYFQQAVEKQPDYALGWAGVSEYYGAGAFYGGLDPAEALPKAEAAAVKAVAFDDKLPQAHNVAAASSFFRHWDGPRALAELTRAVELDPGYAASMHLHALILAAMGRYDEALAVQGRATAIDPIAHPSAMAEILMMARHEDEALVEAELRFRDFPEAKDLVSTLAELYRRKGRERDSAELLARLYARPGEPRRQELWDAFARAGYPGVVRWRLAELEKAHYVAPTKRAQLYAELGDREKTLTLLKQALATHDPALAWMDTEAAYDRFHGDVRYAALLRSTRPYESGR